MEKIKAKVEQVLHKNDHTTDNTTGTHTGTHGTHGVTGNSGTHTGYTAEERRGNPTHIGETGHTGGLTGSTAHSGGLTGNTTHTGTHTGGGSLATPTAPILPALMILALETRLIREWTLIMSEATETLLVATATPLTRALTLEVA